MHMFLDILHPPTLYSTQVRTAIDELSESPATSTLAPMWECLDAELENLPLEVNGTKKS